MTACGQRGHTHTHLDGCSDLTGSKESPSTSPSWTQRLARRRAPPIRELRCLVASAASQDAGGCTTPITTADAEGEGVADDPGVMTGVERQEGVEVDATLARRLDALTLEAALERRRWKGDMLGRVAS